tara:strand:- start:48 stop:731 length:684 start_codon:yes stop_codon:yes gene_type:complete
MNPQRLIFLISGFVIFLGILSASVLAQVGERPIQNNEHEVHPIETLPEQKKRRKKETGDKNGKSFRTVEWLDLMPKKDLDALLNPPDYISQMEEGAFEDEILTELRNMPKEISDPYQQALVSTEVIKEMDGQRIRIPGFVVPLEFGENKKVTQFFLVPYFGACIHVPPPPPNQIIFVTSKKGLAIKELYDPLWISGIISTSRIENDVALAAYKMEMEFSEIYEEEEG